jgi:hypothetical protein
MTALDKDTPTPEVKATDYEYSVAANVRIYGGAIIVLEAGYAKPGYEATGLKIVGVAKKGANNLGGAAGAKKVVVQLPISEFGGQRLFKFKNGDTIVQADVGKTCFILDDQTVVKGGTGRSAAGRITRVETDGVWVAVEIAESAADVAAVAADLAALTAADIPIVDAGTLYTATNVETALAEVRTLADEIEAAAPGMQAVNATLSSGTITISSGITVAANSEVVPLLIGALSGTTNFGSLGELKTSRVVGGPGVGTVVIQAYGDDGALDSDAAGAIRVVILTPF